jgi:hypothetical protein
MITQAFAQAFAAEWIEAWNSHDLDRIFSHYADDFGMNSPLIVERMGIASGSLEGKLAIRPYWTAGLAAQPPLHFVLENVFIGVDSITIEYHRVGGRHATEVLFFGSDKKAIRGVAHYK